MAQFDFGYKSGSTSTDFSNILGQGANGPQYANVLGQNPYGGIPAPVGPIDLGFGQQSQLGMVPGSGGSPVNLNMAGFAPEQGGFSNWLNQNGSNLELGLKGVGAAAGVFNAFNGFQQLKYAKKAFQEGRRQFDLNFGAQKQLTNSRLEDRQNARNATGGNYESTDSYMEKYGIK